MALIEDLGIAYIQKISAKMGFMFREQPKHDHGIDAQIETCDDSGLASGRLIAVQIKSGESYIRRNKSGDLVYYANERHISYWHNHSLPVILIIYSPKQKKLGGVMLNGI